MRRPGRLTGELRLRAIALTAGAAALGLLAILASARHPLAPAFGAEAAARSGLLRSTEVGGGGPTPTPLGTLGLARLTDPDCCIPIGWTTDSRSLLVLAQPSAEDSALVLSVPVEGGAAVVAWERPAAFSPDGSLAVEAEGTRVRLTRRVDGESWTIANDGRELRFAHSGSQVAWDVASKGIAHPDVREHALWVAEVTGAGARKLATTIGGGLVGWAQGGQALVATGRIGADGQEGIWSIPLDGSGPILLHQVFRPRDVLLSPAGGWVAFYAAFTGDSGQNGLWVLRIDGTSISKVTPFGSFRWRDEGHLLLIPLTNALPPSLFEVDPAAGRAVQLTDPMLTSLPIANADWLVSPDGTRVAFTSWADRAVWVLTLPEEG
jgi:hypothetical protein